MKIKKPSKEGLKKAQKKLKEILERKPSEELIETLREKDLEYKIKPCPFCGKEPDIQSSWGAIMISCDTLGCALGFVDEKEAFADNTIKKWNNRFNNNTLIVNEVIQKAIGDIYDDLGTEPYKKVLSTQEVQTILIGIEILLIEKLGD